jgi:hypothetical protein
MAKERMKRAYTVADVEKIVIKELELKGRWEAAFGRPQLGDTWFITGKSASGKSSFVMLLAKELCGYGLVLYISLEEGVGLSFKTRLIRYRMSEVRSRFKIVLDDGIDILRERLRRPKSPSFIIVDSFQFAGWSYEETKKLVTEEFPGKTFIFVSQEYKGSPMGKAAVRLKYLAGVKIRTVGFRAYCEGRYSGGEESYFTIWEEGAIKNYNEV